MTHLSDSKAQMVAEKLIIRRFRGSIKYPKRVSSN
jgi:hypothetical protein